MSNAILQDSFEIRIRLRRIWDVDALSFYWSIDLDETGGRNFSNYGSMSIFCTPFLDIVRFNLQYENENKQKAYFDDIIIRSAYRDESAGPKLREWRTINRKLIELEFGYDLSTSPPPNAADYILDLPGYFVSEVEVAGNKALLHINEYLPQRGNLKLLVVEVEGDNGRINYNQRITLFLDFEAVPPNYRNIRLNEVMIDPTPQVGLPNAEYLELYNASNQDVILDDLKVSAGGFPQSIGTGVLGPKEYLVLTKERYVQDFADAGISARGMNLATFANNGDGVALTYQGRNIHRIVYDRSWYNDTLRDDGGYSLEYTGELDLPVVALLRSCTDGWRASQDPAGGTPGRVNSVVHQADSIPPGIQEITYTSSQITITFTEDIYLSRRLNLGDFRLEPEADMTTVYTADAKTVILNALLDTNRQYSLFIDPVLGDCYGNVPEKPLVSVFGEDVGTTTSNQYTGFDDFPQLTLVNPSSGTSFSDNWQVIYAGGRSFYQLSGQVYDIHGRLMQDLPEVKLSGREGVVEWPGRASLHSGYYSILLRLVSEQGPTLLLPQKAVIIR